ncbi:hypothetical protein [Falsiroseomonas oryzae]|uniref:hypothetical protein n=1 Tax=Falsiroseomonas oryzae TaxID=2766473 RepID=UPI0022EA34A7|nr:hypothetical protein [Roseomonas sp. MO-31]
MFTTKLLRASQLQEADILLKYIPAGSFISNAIGLGQAFEGTIKRHGLSEFEATYGIDPTRFSHAALVMGPDEIFEFDEGSGILDIMKFKGAGVVNSSTRDPSRAGNSYLVIRSRNRELARRAWRKALTVKSFAATSKTASYGLRKLAIRTIFGYKGPSMSDQHIREELAKLRGEESEWGMTHRANFFCSHFVTFVYLWAAHEMSKLSAGGQGCEWLLGIDQCRISPAELCMRLFREGGGNFECVGGFAPSLA